jgi:hypothetical protein
VWATDYLRNPHPINEDMDFTGGHGRQRQGLRRGHDYECFNAVGEAESLLLRGEACSWEHFPLGDP